MISDYCVITCCIEEMASTGTLLLRETIVGLASL